MQVCRRLRGTYLESKRLQYIVELALAGFIDSLKRDPRSNLNGHTDIAQRLDLLQRYQEAYYGMRWIDVPELAKLHLDNIRSERELFLIDGVLAFDRRLTGVYC